MDDVRRIAIQLVAKGLIEVTQQGKVVDIETASGPIRFRTKSQ